MHMCSTTKGFGIIALGWIGVSLSLQANYLARFQQFNMQPEWQRYPKPRHSGYGEIYFRTPNQILSYTINRYNSMNQKTDMETFDGNGNLMQINQFNYNKHKHLVQETQYNKKDKITTEIVYSPNTLFPPETQAIIHKKSIYKISGHYLVDYEYTLNETNKPLYIVQKIYVVDYQHGKQCVQVNTDLYNYSKNNITIEHFSKNNTSATDPSNIKESPQQLNNIKMDGEFQFQGSEIHEYLFPEYLNRIIYLNKYKNIEKILAYQYNDEFQIEKIEILQPKNNVSWKYILDDEKLMDAFEMKQFILFVYAKNKLNKIFDSWLHRKTQIQKWISKMPREKSILVEKMR